MTLRLSGGFSSNPLTQPIHNRDIVPEGIEWATQAVHPSELFWRQLHSDEFDVFEMSLSTCFRLASLEDRRWVALPIFTTRQLCHLSIKVTERSGISAPGDLRGRRIGVPEYQQTSAVWSRGVLDGDFGVAPEDVDWYMERGTDRSHGAETAFTAPAGVRITTIPADHSIGGLLASGELDGTLLYLGERNLVDRSPALSDTELGVRPLFDPAAERSRWGDRPSHATHCVAVRRQLAEEHPEIVSTVRAAFDAAKRAAGVDPAEDAWPYGYTANAPMLATLAGHVHRQGIAVRPVAPEEIFAAQVLAT